MAEKYTGDVDEHSTRQVKAMPAHGREHSAGAVTDNVEGHDLARSISSGVHLDGRGSAPQRATSMLQMQKTYGNRAVQRYVQRSTTNGAAPLPVQREGEGEEPFVPKFTPFPYPKLELPFGNGSGIAANPSGIDYNWKTGGLSGKLGYEYGGNLTGEAKFGDYWLKGGVGKEGFGLGLGYGNPLITPPGIPPMGNDPSGDLRGGSLDPRTIGKSLDEISESKTKPGWSWGVQGGKNQELGPYGWAGAQYNW